MEAIKTYLETMFSALPQTEESWRLKNELMISMEEKYNELKAEGKSENEAIGTVISEFGNIEELADEMGLKPEKGSNKEPAPLIDLATAQEFLNYGFKTAKMTAAGVFLIVMGAALLVAIMLGGIAPVDVSEEFNPVRLAAGISALLVFVAIGVAIIAPTWLKFMKFEFVQNDFRLPEHVKQYVKSCKEEFLPKMILYIVIGVVVCILAVLFIVVPAIAYIHHLFFGIAGFLAVSAFGVVPLILMGITQASIYSLLKPGYFRREFMEDYSVTTRGERIIGVVAAIFWPLITAGYLLWSFLSGNWHITWIIWPVAGLLFGAFAGGIGAYYNISDNDEDVENLKKKLKKKIIEEIKEELEDL